jgi:hypothetical protein
MCGSDPEFKNTTVAASCPHAGESVRIPTSDRCPNSTIRSLTLDCSYDMLARVRPAGDVPFTVAA